MHVKETTTIGEGKLYAPGNLRATFDNPAYEKVSSESTGNAVAHLLDFQGIPAKTLTVSLKHDISI